MNDKYARALARLDDIQGRNITWNTADEMAELLRALLVERSRRGQSITGLQSVESSEAIAAALDAFVGGA